MSAEENNYATLRTLAFSATIAMGVILEFIGIHMLYKDTMVTFSAVSFFAAPLPLIIGVILIIVALVKFPKTRPTEQHPAKQWSSKNWLFLLGIVLLAVFFALHYQPGQDAKYRLLVDLILIMLGFTAAVGYGIYKWISHNIEGRVEKMADDDRNVARAEAQMSLGFAFFQHHEAEKGRQKEMKELRFQRGVERKVLLHETDSSYLCGGA